MMAPRSVSIGFLGAIALVTLAVALLVATDELKVTLGQLKLLPLRQELTPVSCEPLAANDDRIVHIDCPLRRLRTFFPPSDFSWNVAPFTGVFFEMKVEMYQWMVEAGAISLTFGGVWSENLIGNPKVPVHIFSKHRNPDFIPYISGAGRHFASDLYGGGFRLEKPHLIDFHKKTQIPLKDDGYYTPSKGHPPTQVDYSNTQVKGNALFTGDPDNPQVGDLRITFWGSVATHVSAIGTQKRQRSAIQSKRRDLVGYVLPTVHDDVSSTTSVVSANGTTIRKGIVKKGSVVELTTLMREGDFTANQLINATIASDAMPRTLRLFLQVSLLICLGMLLSGGVNLGDPSMSRPFSFVAGLLCSGGLILFVGGFLRLVWAPLIGAALVASGLTSIAMASWLWMAGRKSRDAASAAAAAARGESGSKEYLVLGTERLLQPTTTTKTEMRSSASSSRKEKVPPIVSQEDESSGDHPSRGGGAYVMRPLISPRPAFPGGGGGSFGQETANTNNGGSHSVDRGGGSLYSPV